VAKQLLVWCLGIGLIASGVGAAAQTNDDRVAARDLMAKRGNAVVSIVAWRLVSVTNRWIA
jgi:hypothetical protein